MVYSGRIKIWDPLVRIFHWSLVGAFLVAYITEEDFLTLHVWAGYTVLGLVLFRILWGFIGSRYARFSSFVFSPAKILQYLKDLPLFKAKRYLGHNPAGGAMILLMLLCLIITSVTGLIAYGTEGLGPFADWLGNSSEFTQEALEEIHEFLANFTLLLVFAHVAGVILESLLHRENLVHAMLSGYKPIKSNKQTEQAQ